MEFQTVQVKLPVVIWREDDQYVAYTPALELSSFGCSEKEAMKNFEEALQLMLETAMSRDSLIDMLESYGWELEEDNWNTGYDTASGSIPFSANIPLPAMHASC